MLLTILDRLRQLASGGFHGGEPAHFQTAVPLVLALRAERVPAEVELEVIGGQRQDVVTCVTSGMLYLL